MAVVGATLDLAESPNVDATYAEVRLHDDRCTSYPE